MGILKLDNGTVVTWDNITPKSYTVDVVRKDGTSLHDKMNTTELRKLLNDEIKPLRSIKRDNKRVRKSIKINPTCNVEIQEETYLED